MGITQSDGEAHASASGQEGFGEHPRKGEQQRGRGSNMPMLVMWGGQHGMNRGHWGLMMDPRHRRDYRGGT